MLEILGLVVHEDPRATLDSPDYLEQRAALVCQAWMVFQEILVVLVSQDPLVCQELVETLEIPETEETPERLDFQVWVELKEKLGYQGAMACQVYLGRRAAWV